MFCLFWFLSVEAFQQRWKKPFIFGGLFNQWRTMINHDHKLCSLEISGGNQWYDLIQTVVSQGQNKKLKKKSPFW